MVLSPTKVDLVCGREIESWYERRELADSIALGRYSMSDWNDPKTGQWHTLFEFDDPDEAFEFRMRVG
jgi:hypothetical protein